MWVNHKIIGSLNLGGFNSWHNKKLWLAPAKMRLDNDFPSEYGHLGLPCSMSGVVGRGSKGLILWAKLGPWVGWFGKNGTNNEMCLGWCEGLRDCPRRTKGYMMITCILKRLLYEYFSSRIQKPQARVGCTLRVCLDMYTSQYFKKPMRK